VWIDLKQGWRRRGERSYQQGLFNGGTVTSTAGGEKGRGGQNQRGDRAM